MDFWAQHKDFVLKVLAGLGVFIVALIARGIYYGDDLETARATNATLAGKIKRLKIAKLPQIKQLEEASVELNRGTATILEEIGWNDADDTLDRTLLERILGYTRAFSDASQPTRDAAVSQAQSALQSDLNGGFGQLRLKVRDALVEEASEKNIEIVPGIGFEGVTEIEGPELRQYLLQLELTARILRACIDAKVDSVSEVRIYKDTRGEVIPGANPEFLQEYFVDVAFRGPQEAVREILNGLDRDKRVPLRELEIVRVVRPANRVDVKLTVIALSSNPTVKFKFEKEGKE